MMASEISDQNVITSLKIQVDNDISQHHDDSIENMDNELEEGEATESESEDEVEVNVIVDSQSSESYKTKYAHNAKDSEDRAKQDKIMKRSNQEKARNYVQKESYRARRKSSIYAHSGRHNPIPTIEQEFGSDMLSPVGITEEKLEKRALRFGVTVSNTALSRAEWMNLWKSLDLTQDDFHRGGFRADAIHLRGIENLRSNEIFDYFKGHNPDNIEWLNNESCNIVFSAKENAAKALIALSCPVIDGTKKVNKNVKEVKSKNVNQKTLPTANPSATKSTKKVKKKAQENKKSNSDSDSSSDDSSSSDSEEEGSSSDSSSSSNSSSSSSSSTSSDSSSSSSSDSSDSEENEINSQIGNDKEETNNNSTNIVPMEVVNSEEQLGTVSVEEVGVSLPPGRWRLGVPCPNAKALLLRYAHCKDKKMPGIEKPVDFYEEYISTRRSNKALEHERHRIQQELMDLERTHHRKNNDDKKSRSKRTHSKKEKADKAALNDVGGKYVDLDNPYDEGKNPWGFLAQNWNKKETQDSLDYQALLHQHVSGQKRKRESDSDSDYDDSRRSHKMPFKRSHHHKKSLSEEDFYSYSEEESDERDDLDDGVDWRSKITMPRMKMYADAEEKRKVKRNTEVRKRIRRNSYKEREIRSRVHFPTKPLQLKQPGFDLRAILESKNLRKREIGFHPNSDGE